MAGKSTFRRPASPDPELRLFSVKPVPAVPPNPFPIHLVLLLLLRSPPTDQVCRRATQPALPKGVEAPAHQQTDAMNQSASQVLLVAVRVSALYMNLTIIPRHHRLILPDLQSTRKPHDRPTHSVGPFDEEKDTVLYTQSDPLRGHFVRTPGAWYETRTHYPMPRRHWGRSDSFSPPPGPNRHLQPTRESFKSARGEHDEELRINQYYWVGNSIMNLHLIFFSSGHD